MAEYGIPYMGSKSSICNELVALFPKTDNFYDIFGGGFSVTHAMLLRRHIDFKKFHFNEIRPGICDLIKSAINGEYSYERFKPKFISREEFFANKETDPYLKMVWSFGNNGKDYLFSPEIEPYKRSMHNAIIFGEFDELAERVLGMRKFKEGYSVQQRRLYLRNRIEFFLKTGVPDYLYRFIKEEQLERLQQLQQLQQLQRLERLQQLQQLQQLERLQQLQQLQQLEFTSKSYEQIPVKENSIVYCDPPYNGTAEYDRPFNTERFLDWCDAQTVPVFISEYRINDKRFCPVFAIEKRSLLSNNSRNKKIEKLFVNRAGFTHLFKPLRAPMLKSSQMEG